MFHWELDERSFLTNRRMCLHRLKRVRSCQAQCQMWIACLRIVEALAPFSMQLFLLVFRSQVDAMSIHVVVNSCSKAPVI